MRAVKADGDTHMQSEDQKNWMDLVDRWFVNFLSNFSLKAEMT